MQKWREKGLHIASNPSDEVQTPIPELLEEMLGNIAIVAYDPALQRSCHGVEGFAIIRIARCDFNRHDSPLLLMTMYSLNPKKTTQPAAATLGQTLENLVSFDPLVVVDSELCGIHEIATGFFTAKALKQYAQWQHQPRHQCHKTTVAWQITKAIAVFLVYAKVPESLER